MEVNQERAKRIKYSQCWFAKLITFLLDKIPVLKSHRVLQETSSASLRASVPMPHGHPCRQASDQGILTLP